jgi:outer membrane lipoprotein LolB
MRWARLGAIALLLSLAACAGRAVRAPLLPGTASLMETQAQRTSALSAHPRWTMQGRVALSNGRQGGSGRIDWQQQDADAYSVSLSAPITRQSWRLSADGRTARLDGMEGGAREGTDAEALLRDATGWVIPVSALGAWVRGVAAPGSQQADMAFDAQGDLAELRQDGWTIDYSDWQTQPALGLKLPHRLTANQGDARVRLIIDAWQEGAGPP